MRKVGISMSYYEYYECDQCEAQVHGRHDLPRGWDTINGLDYCPECCADIAEQEEQKRRNAEKSKKIS